MMHLSFGTAILANWTWKMFVHSKTSALAKTIAPYFHCFAKHCFEGKQHRVAFPNKGKRRTIKPLEIVHFDICGLKGTTSMGGARYFVIFIDNFLRKVWLYALKSKGKCFEIFKEFRALVKTQLVHKIKAVWSDNGGKFTSKVVNQFLKDHNIEKQTSIPYKLEQDGLVEYVNRTIVERARNMLHAQNLHKFFLGGNGGFMRFTYKTDVQLGCWIPLHTRKRGVGGGLTLHTYVCSDVLSS